MKTRRLDLLNWQEIRGLIPEKIKGVILPIGTIEAHGATALGTDSILAEKIAEKMAPKINCLIAPTINYGITNTLLQYPGSITVSRESFMSYVLDIFKGLARLGFDRILVMNGHGGQEKELNELVTEYNKSTGVKMLQIEWWYFCNDPRIKVYDCEIDGGHAGLEETAMMLGLCPEGVRKDLFDPKIVASFEYKFRAVPAPGTILSPPDAPDPVFDEKLGGRFTEEIIEILTKTTLDVFKQWDTLLG
jgi:creatinine amidohydrolase